jgi:hypothetical protein
MKLTKTKKSLLAFTCLLWYRFVLTPGLPGRQQTKLNQDIGQSEELFRGVLRSVIIFKRNKRSVFVDVTTMDVITNKRDIPLF